MKLSLPATSCAANVAGMPGNRLRQASTLCGEVPVGQLEKPASRPGKVAASRLDVDASQIGKPSSCDSNAFCEQSQRTGIPAKPVLVDPGLVSPDVDSKGGSSPSPSAAESPTSGQSLR